MSDVFDRELALRDAAKAQQQRSWAVARELRDEIDYLRSRLAAAEAARDECRGACQVCRDCDKNFAVITRLDRRCRKCSS